MAVNDRKFSLSRWIFFVVVFRNHRYFAEKTSLSAFLARNIFFKNKWWFFLLWRIGKVARRCRYWSSFHFWWMFWIMAAHWTPSWTTWADNILAFWAMMVSEIVILKNLAEIMAEIGRKRTWQRPHDHCAGPFSRPSFFHRIRRRK